MKFVDIHTHANWDSDRVQISDLSGKSRQQIDFHGYFSLGIHPWFVKENTLNAELHEIENKIGNRNFIALGECGLDKMCKTNFALQLNAFKKQIELSEKYKKPLILHVVKAFNEIIKLKQETKSKQVWIIHGFNGSPQLAGQLIDMGFFLSYGIQLKNKTSKACKSIVGAPPHRIFLETDNAELSIQEIYALAAQCLETEIEQLQKQLSENFNAVFM